MRWYIPVIGVIIAISIIIFILISQGIFSSNSDNNDKSILGDNNSSSRRNFENSNELSKKYSSITINNITNGINHLGLQITKDVHRRLPNDTPDQGANLTTQTIAFSPFNIAEALYLLLLGSSGKTFNELATVLNLSDPKYQIRHNSQNVHEQFGLILQSLENFTEETLQLTTASGIFVQDGYPIGKKYREMTTNIYKSELKSLDFINNAMQAQNIINNWVLDKTNGKIKDILTEPPSSSTKVILSTALYFKGAWEHPFSNTATHQRAFYPYGRENKNESIMVDMMLNYGNFLYNHNKEFDCEIFALPYKGDLISMYIIVPKKSNIDKLLSLEKRLTEENIQQFITDLNMTRAAIIMPKMKIETTTTLPTILEHIGVHDLFDSVHANLGVLSPGENNNDANNKLTIDEIRDNVKLSNTKFYVEEIIHKVYIDINESGTEAAATTDVIIPRSGGIRMLVLDHPFIFFIRHHQLKINLFYGFVESPPVST